MDHATRHPLLSKPSGLNLRKKIIADMIWVIVPIVAIAAPFLYSAYVKRLKFQKMQMKMPISEDYDARLAEAEDALEAAQRRIENLESIVVARLLEDPSSKESMKIDASELIAQRTPK